MSRDHEPRRPYGLPPTRSGDTEAFPLVQPAEVPAQPGYAGRAGDTEPLEVVVPAERPARETTPAARVGQGVGIAALILMVGNILSRVLGLVREQTASWLFGTGDAIAAFTIADNIHTMLFDLVISGMMQAALIPVLSEYAADEDRDELRRITGALITLAVLVIGTVVGVLMLFAPAAVDVMTALGGGEDARGADTVALTVELTRWILPAVFLLGISTILMSTLFALQRFTLPSLSLSLRNVAIVTSALALGRGAFGVRSMALGIVLGALLLIVVQLPGLRDALPRPNLGFGHPAIRKIMLLYLPIFVGLFANTLALVVDRNLAWGVGEDALGAMRYATTLNQMVLGLVAAAISLASLPAMSRYWADGDLDGYWATLANGIRMITVLAVPATLGLAVLSWPAVQLLFQHGATDREGALQILIALLVYLPGTLFAAYDQALIFAYYARQNTRTPQTVGVVAVGVYFVFALALVRPLGMAGLVAANSAQFVFHTLVMYVLVRRLFPAGSSAAQHFDARGLTRTLRVCVTVGLVMAAIAGGFALLLATGLPPAAGGLGRLLREMVVLGLPATIGALVYAAGLLVLGVEEMRLIKNRLLRVAQPLLTRAGIRLPA